MGVELNRIMIPACSAWASATFLASILDVPAGPPREPFVPVTVGNGVSPDFVDAVRFGSHRCAFLVGGTEFDAALARIRGAGITYYVGPAHQRPGGVSHLRGGRGLYFDDPDGHTIEITTQPHGDRLDRPGATGQGKPARPCWRARLVLPFAQTPSAAGRRPKIGQGRPTMSAVGWKLVYGGRTPPPGAVVRPGERLSSLRMAGLGAQHVVAMFGATFVFPAIMGLSPNLAVLMSGVATILFLLIVSGKVPSYLGTSASFVAAVEAIRAQGGNSADVTGAILIAGLILAAVGVIVHFGGSHYVRAVLPPVVTGAVVMLIGFNLAAVATKTYFPQDQWVALLTTAFLIGMTVLGPGFLGRIAVFLALVFGWVISWIADRFSTVQSCSAAGKCVAVHRITWSGVAHAPWIGLPKTVVSPTFGVLSGPHLPAFKATFILLVIPSVIALLAENAGHVKAVSEMTGDDLDPYLGRAFIGDGIGTALASAVGGSPTTTYAENIGVMAATRVYSTLAYFIAATVAILFGFCPKFGAIVAATPGGVLGGITLVLYGMIGLLGAKIWVENRVDFADPVNLVPLAAGIIAGIGDLAIKFTSTFSITGIAAGTLIVLIGYHGVRPFARRAPEPSPAGEGAYAGGAPPVTARESRRSRNRERPHN